MGFYTGDPAADAENYYEAAALQAERRPCCDICEEHIQEEYRYRIDGMVLCFDCLMDYINDNFRERNED